jgi:hypothetical protein
MNYRNLSTLIAGVVFVGLGCLFLAVNVYQVDIPWFMAVKLVLPVLFIWAGALKLCRHFTWTLEKLQEKPGKAGLLSGLFWLSLGLVAALAVFHQLGFLTTVGMYWPVILLLFGVGKIVDFFRMKEISRSNFTEITGVIFIILFGLGCMKLHELNVLVLEKDPFWNRIPEFIGIEELMDPIAEFSSIQDIELEGAEGIEIRNVYGDISVEGTGVAEGKITAELVSSLRDRDETRAREISDQIQIKLMRENGTLIVTTNRKELKSLGKKVTTSLSLKIPDNLKLKVNNEYGDVSVSGMNNDCSLTAKKGEVHASSIDGLLQIKNESESVELRDIEGDVTIDASFSKVHIDDVKGNVSATTSHKSVWIGSVTGNLIVENRHDDVEVENISGTVTINNPGGEVSLSGITGPVTVVNSKGDVSISGAAGSLDLTTAYGDVNLDDVEGAVEITARHSDIEGHGFNSSVTLRGQNTEINLEDLAGDLVVETSQEPVYVSDVRGSVNIQNDLGEIVLRLLDNPGAGIRIESRQGDIQLELPSQAAFSLNARVTNGTINSDFGSPEGKDVMGDSSFKTTIGANGPEISLLTSGSVIAIRRIQ